MTETIEKEGLEPCPFCGGRAEVKYWNGGYDQGCAYSVSCADWKCPSKTSANDPEVVRAAWNRRAPSPPAGELREKVRAAIAGAVLPGKVRRENPILYSVKDVVDSAVLDVIAEVAILALPRGEGEAPVAWRVESVASPGEAWEWIEGREPTEYAGDPAFVIRRYAAEASRPTPATPEGLREKVARALCNAVSPIDGSPILGLDPDYDDRPEHPSQCDEGEMCGKDVLALADAILAALLAQPGPGEWRDIDSAPRDGTYFLAHWPHMKATYAGRMAGIYMTHWTGWGGGCWEADSLGSPTAQPTHWMPLPAAPDTTRTGDGG